MIAKNRRANLSNWSFCCFIDHFLYIFCVLLEKEMFFPKHFYFSTCAFSGLSLESNVGLISLWLSSGCPRWGWYMGSKRFLRPYGNHTGSVLLTKMGILGYTELNQVIPKYTWYNFGISMVYHGISLLRISKNIKLYQGYTIVIPSIKRYNQVYPGIFWYNQDPVFAKDCHWRQLAFEKIKRPCDPNEQMKGLTARCPRDLLSNKCVLVLFCRFLSLEPHVKNRWTFSYRLSEKHSKIACFKTFELAKLASYLQIYASQRTDKFGK